MPPIQLSALSPNRLSLRSIPPTLNQTYKAPLQRRQSKATARRTRAKEAEEVRKEVIRKEVVTYISQRGKVVRHKIRD